MYFQNYEVLMTLAIIICLHLFVKTLNYDFKYLWIEWLCFSSFIPSVMNKDVNPDNSTIATASVVTSSDVSRLWPEQDSPITLKPES